MSLLPSLSNSMSPSGSAGAAPADPTDGATLLVVDDTLTNRQILAVFLRKLGHIVDLAEDGAKVDGAPIGRLKAFHGQAKVDSTRTTACALVLLHHLAGSLNRSGYAGFTNEHMMRFFSQHKAASTR